MGFHDELRALLESRRAIVRENIPRSRMIREAIENRECVPARCGALATWTPVESSGRSPKDTMIVRRPESESNIDWTSPNNIPMTPGTFDMLLEDALATLRDKSDRIYVTDRSLGADDSYTLPVRTVTDWAASALFTDNMFRPVPEGGFRSSCFSDRPFTLIALPYHKLDPVRYEGRFRVDPRLGHTSTMAVAMDMDRFLGVVYGSAYGGSVKKLMFTVMNYILPAESILPLHCSANEGPQGDMALLLGLSGTGKTTLSADPSRALLGDDEHGWTDHGVSNFENGCYAKLIDLNPLKEPEIHNACFHEAPVEEHGAIIENAMMYPWGEFDLFDDRFTPNSRGSYPLTYLSNIKPSSRGGHPRTILFLTADANGVLPPISRLTTEQAMLWFLMGYTSKLAGTETGIVDPKSTFSRFFGEPFMPRNPDVYATMLGDRLRKHGTKVYLVNTGWSGGPYGTGSRIDLPITRQMVHAALDGSLESVEYDPDPIFKVSVPRSCPGIDDPSILTPVNTWQDRQLYDQRAAKLASEFAAHFEKAYADKGIPEEIAAACPGR
ncbi:phosphoenolpyruvate carboxykinase (ATP) [Candidatus Fermentibacterales bacterium]|nr:phosphoenolpyruvate carboxykinase (ATP) [Candidatus Fermentibacterales bacterium]